MRRTVGNFKADTRVFIPVDLVSTGYGFCEINIETAERCKVNVAIPSDTECFEFPENAVQSPSGKAFLTPDPTPTSPMNDFVKEQIFQSQIEAAKAEGKAEAWKEAFVLSQEAQNA